PTIADLAERAKRRIPPVAWAYLQTGTGQEEALYRNTKAFERVCFQPQFCAGAFSPEIATSLFGTDFSAPFGIAPIGLSGLIWPRSEVYLAQSATRLGIPYALSTVATETPEAVGPHLQGNGWFQLYPPKDPALRRELLTRATAAGFGTLLLTLDVPVPSRRERTRRAGLQTPPKITPDFIWQGITHPRWSWHTLSRGLPQLRTVVEYAQSNNMKTVGNFLRYQWRENIDWRYCEEVRAAWDGPLVLKGILHPADAQRAVAIGADGIVVSNHGGRQFDGAPASLEVLPQIVRAVDGQIKILFDSGVRSGLDIIRALHLGADFVLLGRAFLYGVAALGPKGGDHVYHILVEDLKNNMQQLGARQLSDLPNLTRFVQ
ncbi:MAG: alpha-hydroxy acid oxidase, partial [Bacteroidota bacterium]